MRHPLACAVLLSSIIRCIISIIIRHVAVGCIRVGYARDAVDCLAVFELSRHVPISRGMTG